MASTKFDVASAALVMIGANPVTSFSSSGNTEQKICYHLYQTQIDSILAAHPWRFATKSVQVSYVGAVANPVYPMFAYEYTEPSGMKALQAIYIGSTARQCEFRRFNGKIYLDVSNTETVYAEHTYEPSVALWPGYFVNLAEVTCALRFAFAISGKLDLRAELEREQMKLMRVAKYEDSKQQSTRKLPVAGRNTIFEARRG